jgi:hypothetical protein
MIVSQNHILEDGTKDSLKETTQRYPNDNEPYRARKESSSITNNHSEDTYSDQAFVGKLLEPKCSKQKSLVDDHDQSDKCHDIATCFSRDTKTFIQEKRKGHLVDHQCQINNKENQIFFIFFGDKHVFENTHDIDRNLFCFSQKLIGFRKSSNDKEHIDQGKKETDNKGHFDSISK